MSYPVRGLRVRLTGFYLAGFTLFLLAGWLGLAWTVDRSLHQSIDLSLHETLRAARDVYAQDRGEFPTEVLLVAHVITELIYADRAMVAYRPDGRLLGRSRQFVGVPVIDSLRPGVVGPVPVTIRTSSGRARALGTTLPGGVELIAAISLAPVDRHRHALMIAMLLLLPLLGAAGVTGLYLARRALRPITALAESASAIGGLVGSEDGPLPRLPTHPVPDELGKLTTEFNRLLDRLTEALARERSLAERQRSFLQDAAHELRTPIAIVRSEAEAALAAARNPEADGRALDLIGGEAARMASVVTDLLWLTRTEGPDPGGVKEPLFLDDLAARHLVRLQRHPAAHNRDLRLGAFEPAPVVGDRTLIERAIVSLLENALLHAAPGPIEVSAGRDDRSAPPMSWVRVRDWGPGIPPDEVERLFERFARRHTAVPGSGLGLAIARRAALIHGGRLDVAHPVQGGVAFTFALPAPHR